MLAYCLGPVSCATVPRTDLVSRISSESSLDPLVAFAVAWVLEPFLQLPELQPATIQLELKNTEMLYSRAYDLNSRRYSFTRALFNFDKK